MSLSGLPMTDRRRPTAPATLLTAVTASVLGLLVFVLDLPGPRTAHAADGTSWTELHPPTRLGHAAIYDAVRDRMLVFGGRQGCILHDEVLALALSGAPEWTEVATQGEGPSGRLGHSGIYDPVRDRFLVFGGHDGAFRNDVWALSLTGTPSWSLINAEGAPPSPRQGHSAVYDPIPSTEPVWSLRETQGSPPNGRQDHTAAYDPLLEAELRRAELRLSVC